MDELEIQNMDYDRGSNYLKTLCRFCGKHEIVNMDIFSEDASTRKLQLKIETCLPFEIRTTDNLPNIICYRCLLSVENFYEFYHNTLMSVSKLESQLDVVNSSVKYSKKSASFSNYFAKISDEKKETCDKCVSTQDLTLEQKLDVNKSTLTDELKCDVCKTSISLTTNKNIVPRQSCKYSEHNKKITSLVDYESDNDSNNEDNFQDCNQRLIENGNHSKDLNTCDTYQKSEPYQNILSEISLRNCKTNQKRVIDNIFNNITTKKRKLENGGVEVSEIVHSTSRRKSKQPKKIETRNNASNTDQSQNYSQYQNITPPPLRNETTYSCLLCELNFITQDILNSHLFDVHGLEPREIFDPRAISLNTMSPKPRKIPNLVRITDVISNRKEKRNGKEDMISSDSEELFDSGTQCVPATVPQQVQFNTESFANALWNERQYFADNPQFTLPPQSDPGAGSGYGLYVCQICARDFNDKASLWLHLRATHPKHASLACGICLRLCLSWQQLSHHTQSEHNPTKLTVAEIRKYFCIICLRQHDSKKKLLNHVYVHDFLIDAYKKSSTHFNPDMFIKVNFGADESVPMPARNENIYSTPSTGNTVRNMKSFGEILYSQLIKNENIEQDIEEVSFHGDYEDNREQLSQLPSNSQSIIDENEIENTSIQKTPRNYTLTYSCEWCSRTLPNKWERWLHVAATHAPHNEALRCSLPHCEKVFVTEAFKIEHEQHHQMQGPVPNSCEVCCKLWNTRVDFYKHMMGVHPHAVPLVCGVCLKIFQTVPKLYEHVQNSHLPLQGDFVCNICGRNYSNKSKMVRHRRIHGANDTGVLLPLAQQPQPTLSRQGGTQKNSKLNLSNKYNSESPSMLFNKHLETAMRLSNDVTNRSLETDSENDQPNTSYNPFQNSLECDALFTNSVTKKTEIYICKECPNAKFSSFDEFSTHKRVLHQIFHCDLCTKYYGRNSHLWKHVNRCHKGNSLVTCQLCYKTSASKYHLQQHFNKLHAIKAEKLKYGNSPHSVDSFLEKKFDGYSFESVKQSFLRQEILEKNQQKLNNEKNNIQNVDNNSSYEYDNISNSITEQDPPPEIDANSELYTSIITNYNPPTSSGAYKCMKCSKHFTKRYLLKKHKKNCRPRLQKDLLTRCKTCERIFKDRQSLQKHLANYHSEFKCHLCSIAFPSKCEIISHIRFTHPKHPDFVCDCGQILRSKSELHAHTMDHRNSHICQFCGDSLASKMKLKMHILSLHRKILSLSCGICLKLFASQHVLRDHVKLVHFRDTKFGNSCSVCGKKYGSKWKCFDHINKSHGKIFKPCKICLSVFENEQEVRDHFTVVHLGLKSEQNDDKYVDIAKSETIDGEQSSDNNDELDEEIVEENDNENNSPTPPESHQTFNMQQPTIPKITLTSNKNQPDNYSIVQKTPEAWPSYVIKSQNESPDDSFNKSLLQNPTKRTVYEDSGAPSMCEICMKTWPAKKHLWQHYIRCHKDAAATICGICLKTHTTYLELRQHLNEKHPSLLHGRGFGSNFICKICGRYHNASSKLKLHMVIHVNYDLPENYDYGPDLYNSLELKQELIDDYDENGDQKIDESENSDSDVDDQLDESYSVSGHVVRAQILDDDVSIRNYVDRYNQDTGGSEFIGFDAHDIQHGENYWHNFTDLLGIQRKHKAEDRIVHKSDSSENSECDSEDERQKLLQKMSPISLRSACSEDNLNYDISEDNKPTIIYDKTEINPDICDEESENDLEEDQEEQIIPKNENEEYDTDDEMKYTDDTAMHETYEIDQVQIKSEQDTSMDCDQVAENKPSRIEYENSSDVDESSNEHQSDDEGVEELIQDIEDESENCYEVEYEDEQVEYQAIEYETIQSDEASNEVPHEVYHAENDLEREMLQNMLGENILLQDTDHKQDMVNSSEIDIQSAIKSIPDADENSMYFNTTEMNSDEVVLVEEEVITEEVDEMETAIESIL